jgi:hypothetical protein
MCIWTVCNRGNNVALKGKDAFRKRRMELAAAGFLRCSGSADFLFSLVSNSAAHMPITFESLLKPQTQF